MPPPNHDARLSVAADLDTLARAIGILVLQWGQAEQSLDLLVASLWQSFGGKKHAKRIPIMLDPKIRFVRTCIAGTPGLAVFQAEAIELLSQFERLSAVRHDLIHGAVASISPVDDAFVFAKLDVQGNFHVHREVRIQAAEHPRLVAALVELGRRTHELAARVFEVYKGTR